MRLLLLLLTVSACSVFDPSLLDDAIADAEVGVEVGPGDGAPEAEVGAPEVAVPEMRMPPGIDPSCSISGSEGVPGPPDVENTDGDEIILGLHELVLDQDRDRWKEIGRNIDGVCTLFPDPVRICEPVTGEETDIQVDGERGIDNVVGASLIDAIQLALSGEDLADIAETSSENGTGSLILRINGYNGQANDPLVEVVQAQSVFGFAGEADETEPAAYEER
ncbi:MAG: hypothetical protein AAF411_26500, partial [Myxococcota bacterium]